MAQFVLPRQIKVIIIDSNYRKVFLSNSDRDAIYLEGDIYA